MFRLQCRLHTNLLFGYARLIGYIVFEVNVVSYNPCVGSLPRIKISLFLL